MFFDLCSFIKSTDIVEKKIIKNPTLGILRLDYNYPPSPGNIDYPKTFNYDVKCRVIPELTFEMCQSGNLPENIINNCIEAVKYLNSKNVSAITGDCGFMINIQDIILKYTEKPVFLSSLVQVPTLIHIINEREKIAIFTANSDSLAPVMERFKKSWKIDANDNKFVIVGCQDVPGFEAVANRKKVDVEKVTLGILKKAKDVIKKNKEVKCILLECTELPPYADALRLELGIPVFDAITNCNSFMAGFLDNKNFGINDWQSEFEGNNEDYSFGQELNKKDLKKLKSKKKLNQI